MIDEKMNEYWEDCAGSFSNLILYQLEHEQKKIWLDLIYDHIPSEKPLEILDIGCGPGFFSLLMALEGHLVTAVDYADEMLKAAEANAKFLGVNEKITFVKADVQELELGKKFDVILSKNCTWILKEPEKAYQKWLDHLKSGGKLLNFDANWYLYLFDDQVKKLYEEDVNKAVQTDYIDEFKESEEEADLDDIIRELPLSNIKRPEWDVRILKEMGYQNIQVMEYLPRNTEIEYFAIKHEHIQRFMICVEVE